MELVMGIDGIRIGHVTDVEHATGCTVILCPDGAVCGVDIRGGASGVYGTDTAGMLHLVPRIHAVVLTGGSAFGLETVFGVMQWLEEQNVGFDVGITKVPIVCGAVIFDLSVGAHDVRPNREWGYQACKSASTGKDVLKQGTVGAGTGATVGKVMGMDCAMKGGLGVASVELPNDVLVTAIAVVNAWGDVIDWRTGQIAAGVYDRQRKQFLNAVKLVKRSAGIGFKTSAQVENTTIATVITNARLAKWQATKLAQFAQNGIALAVRPAHTMFDGDTAFALSIGDKPADLNALGIATQEAIATAILNAVTHAESIHNIPTANDVV